MKDLLIGLLEEKCTQIVEEFDKLPLEQQKDILHEMMHADTVGLNKRIAEVYDQIMENRITLGNVATTLVRKGVELRDVHSIINEFATMLNATKPDHSRRLTVEAKYAKSKYGSRSDGPITENDSDDLNDFEETIEEMMQDNPVKEMDSHEYKASADYVHSDIKKDEIKNKEAHDQKYSNEGNGMNHSWSDHINPEYKHDTNIPKDDYEDKLAKNQKGNQYN